MQPLGVVRCAEPEIEKRLRAGGQGWLVGGEWHACILEHVPLPLHQFPFALAGLDPATHVFQAPLRR
jgi:hypothetical protein